MENPDGLNEKFARENLPDATLIIHDANQEIPGLLASGEADVSVISCTLKPKAIRLHRAPMR